MQAIDITVAQPDDADEVIRLFGALHQHNATLDPRFALAEGWQALVRVYLHQAQQAQDSLWLLARHAGRAIGFILVEVHLDAPLYRHRRWAEIVGLYVEPAYRGRQVAQQLVARAVAWARERQLGVMQLYVTAGNYRARRFYARQGFITSQVIMRRTLDGAPAAEDQTWTHAAERLHFSESGIRPLDMHEQQHRASGAQPLPSDAGSDDQGQTCYNLDATGGQP
ncbi:GNAT family N-acetyltransferase [Kallotenue papyrolyticum]|uniref:GNAT family N-acetyltransferase n=1 Tax=Kallotenue papyrolyticum TaxID=1325125 RepID=UPI0004785EE4|nr:GNAT family N-acetyltransferase [Kallotenue papyrolyticum]